MTLEQALQRHLVPQEGEVAFLIGTMYTELTLPPEGAELTDLASFVHEVLATEFNATGLDTYLSGFFSLFSLAGVRLTRFEIGSLEDLSGGPFFVGFQFAGQSWELLPDTGFSNGDKLAVKDPGFTLGYLGSSEGYVVDVYGKRAIVGVQGLVSMC